MRASEDKLLVWSALKKINGGNVHDGDELIASYRNAVEVATDLRCRGRARREAMLVMRAAEADLRKFVYPESEEVA